MGVTIKLLERTVFDRVPWALSLGGSADYFSFLLCTFFLIILDEFEFVDVYVWPNPR